MAKQNVVIVDYGLGNLFNVHSAMVAAGVAAKVSSSTSDLATASHVILPGVGAFADGMKGLQERGLVKPLKDFAASGRPLMGICLGMQLLLSESSEFGRHEGLGIVGGRVTHFQPPEGTAQFKVPHIGWNLLNVRKKSKLLEGLEENSADIYLYYLHSYIAKLDDDASTIASTEFGRDNFCAVFQSRNVVGVQAHPERSGEAGIQLFSNFLRYEEIT